MYTAFVTEKMHIVILVRDTEKYKGLMHQALVQGLKIEVRALEPNWYDICVYNYYCPAPALILGEQPVQDFIGRCKVVGNVFQMEDSVIQLEG